MSERRKAITPEGSPVKKVLLVILIAIILFGVYLASTALFGFLFGRRAPPSDELANATQEDVELYDLSFNLFDLMALLNPEDLLQYADEPVFYIEDYNPFDESWLWKFSVMDEYRTDGSWSQSVSGVSPTQFSQWYEYNNYYSDRDMLKIKMPIDATSGKSSLVIPSLFPTPHIMDRPWVEPGDRSFDQYSTLLYKDIFDVASLELNFYSDYSGNLTYELFGQAVMRPDELNQSAIHETYTPTSIKDQYYQLPDPGGIPGYIQNHPNVKTHYDALDTIINYSDNTYVKANKIRNYLQTNFDVDIYPPFDRPSQGEDVVEWFCGTKSGIFSDFAAAFTVFARAFGIASRYVDGFNSRYTTEEYNPMNDNYYRIIKRLNLYSWSEIYVPLAVDGSGVWAEMDILFESFGGGNPLTFEGMELIVYTNSTAPVVRGNDVEITAEISLNGVPQEGVNITFEDVTENIPNLGQAITDNQGACSIIINIDTNTVVGPHLIQASTGLTRNFTIYFLDAPIVVNLSSVLPNYVDKTYIDFTNIIGKLIDPANGKGVANGEVEYILLDSLNNRILGAFAPTFIYTDINGEFNTLVRVNDNVPSGNYSVRVDFNGSFNINVPLLSNPIPFYYPLLNSSSSTLPLDIMNPSALSLDLYINGIANDDFDNPIVNRYDWVELKAILYSIASGFIQGEEIIFYDITQGTPGNSSEIGRSWTDFNGEAIYWYNLDFDKIAGPHLIAVEYGSMYNYSYFILNERVKINLNPPRPVPNIINRTDEGDYMFNINGSIVDDTNNKPLKHAIIIVKLLRGFQDYTPNLQPIFPSMNPFYCGESGTFDLNFNVNDAILPGNYSIRVDFNGTFDYTGQVYSHFYNLPYINTSTSTQIDLKIEAPDIFIFNFWINGTPSSEYEQPVVKRNQDLNLTVFLQSGTDPVVGELVEFYDLTNNNSLIGVKITDLNGYANISYDLDSISLAAGPHLIYARSVSFNNYSYFILNESIYVDLISGPTPPIVNRSGSSGTSFNLHGYVRDRLNDLPIKNCWINFRMFEGPQYRDYLNIDYYNCGSSGEFNVDFDVDDITPAINYTLRIEFEGVFNYLTSPYIYYFNLISFNNFVNSTQGFQELKVLDPDDILIEFWINGTETSSNYNDGNPPETFRRNEYVNFTVRVYQSGIPQSTANVRLYDVLEDNINPIDVQPSDGQGYATFVFVLDNTWVAGPHKIRVQWESYSTSNYTYIVLNETVKVEISADTNSVIRNVDWITVSGFVNDTYKISNPEVKYVEVSIKLFNKDMVDSSSYINFDVGYSSTMIVQGPDWDYEFRFQVDLSIHYGEYFLRVDFNGSIRDYSAPVSINLNNYMNSSMSQLKPLNISATTTIINGYYDAFSSEEDVWYVGEVIKIYGRLLYDNGSAVENAQMNITLEDPYGSILAWNDTEYTDINGDFYAEITIQEGWDPEKIFASSVINNNFIIDTIKVELPRN